MGYPTLDEMGWRRWSAPTALCTTWCTSSSIPSPSFRVPGVVQRGGDTDRGVEGSRGGVTKGKPRGETGGVTKSKPRDETGVIGGLEAAARGREAHGNHGASRRVMKTRQSTLSVGLLRE